jgi:hypothetical protein
MVGEAGAKGSQWSGILEQEFGVRFLHACTSPVTKMRP